jgi:hypothetical protein
VDMLMHVGFEPRERIEHRSVSVAGPLRPPHLDRITSIGAIEHRPAGFGSDRRDQSIERTYRCVQTTAVIAQ